MPYKSDTGTAYCTSNPHLENSIWGRIYIYVLSVLNRVKENVRANESETCEGKAPITIPTAAFVLMEPTLSLQLLCMELTGACTPGHGPAH